jgi:radial spoke head protein 4A
MNPQLPPMPQEEFISGPDITEIEDPSPAEEQALKKAQEAGEEDQDAEGQEEESGEEEEDEDN